MRRFYEKLRCYLKESETPWSARSVEERLAILARPILIRTWGCSGRTGGASMTAVTLRSGSRERWSLAWEDEPARAVYDRTEQE